MKTKDKTIHILKKDLTLFKIIILVENFTSFNNKYISSYLFDT